MKLHGVPFHPSITADRVVRILEDSEGGSGICIACGEEIESGVEPDAEKYHCDSCHRDCVYGTETVLLCVAL